MSIDRRSFFKNLGIGSIIFGAGGIFKIEQENVAGISEEVIKPVGQDEILRIAGAILDALDGKATDPNIYNFVRASLTQGTIYEGDGVYTHVDKEVSVNYKQGKRNT